MRPSPRNRGEKSCWISRVRRCSPVPSLRAAYSSQSSFAIIWKTTRLPSGDSAGASTRSTPVRTAVARSGRGGRRDQHLRVRLDPRDVGQAPSVTGEGGRAARTRVAVAAGRPITPKRAFAPPAPRLPCARGVNSAAVPVEFTSCSTLSGSPLVIATGGRPSRATKIWSAPEASLPVKRTAPSAARRTAVLRIAPVSSSRSAPVAISRMVIRLVVSVSPVSAAVSRAAARWCRPVPPTLPAAASQASPRASGRRHAIRRGRTTHRSRASSASDFSGASAGASRVFE